MRRMRRFVRNVVIMMLVGRAASAFVKKQTSPKGVKKTLMEVMPKFMDSLLGKLKPARRQALLAHCHKVLGGLEHKYGTAGPTPATEEEEEPAEVA